MRTPVLRRVRGRERDGGMEGWEEDRGQGPLRVCFVPSAFISEGMVRIVNLEELVFVSTSIRMMFLRQLHNISCVPRFHHPVLNDHPINRLAPAASSIGARRTWGLTS